MPVGEGVEGGDGGCDHTEAGWSKRIRDLVSTPPTPPPPSAAAVWKGLRFQLSHNEEGNFVEEGEGGRRAAEENSVNALQLFILHTQLITPESLGLFFSI